jgi:hypothetical protein
LPQYARISSRLYVVGSLEPSPANTAEEVGEEEEEGEEDGEEEEEEEEGEEEEPETPRMRATARELPAAATAAPAPRRAAEAGCALIESCRSNTILGSTSTLPRASPSARARQTTLAAS